MEQFNTKETLEDCLKRYNDKKPKRNLALLSIVVAELLFNTRIAYSDTDARRALMEFIDSINPAVYKDMPSDD